jgi:molybdate transport system regulatory protein
MTTKPSRKKACAAVIVRPRIQFGPALAIGPGKIDLLRAVAETHSISAAARALGLTYKRAWLLIDTLNAGFGRPVVETATGGRGGGGAPDPAGRAARGALRRPGSAPERGRAR